MTFDGAFLAAASSSQAGTMVVLKGGKMDHILMISICSQLYIVYGQQKAG